MRIDCFPSDAIDRGIWDRFVDASDQGSVYVKSVALDTMCAPWELVILSENGTWLAAMPIPARSKWMFKYALQPLFLQYGGPLFSPEVNQDAKGGIFRELQHKLAQVLKRRYAYFRLHAAPGSVDPGCWTAEGCQVSGRISYLLDLSVGESKLRSGLSQNIRRKLSKAKPLNDQLSTVETRELVGLFEQVKGKELPFIRAIHYESYIGWVNELRDRGEAEICAYRDANGRLQAGIILLMSREKVIYSLGVQHPDVAKQGVLASMLWKVIVQSAERGFGIFDFEGSMHPGIARFFAGFGAEPHTFFELSGKPFWVPAALKYKSSGTDRVR